ncbi:unnamed protein product, partial [Acanthosepion pharaonis]
MRSRLGKHIIAESILRDLPHSCSDVRKHAADDSADRIFTQINHKVNPTFEAEEKSRQLLEKAVADIQDQPGLASEFLYKPVRPYLRLRAKPNTKKAFVEMLRDVIISPSDRRRPVVVVDGAKNWTAPKTFSFEFFKGIYSENSPALESKGYNCQFFPYQTEFANLAEVFQMEPERIKNTDHSKPWYIGWSNCDFSAANILRKHYSKPYFLPKSSESSKTDWIFMGTPGYGAHMHVDNVGNPSWQAQVTGHKRWSLMPPPECYFDCKHSLEVIVNPGEIIDTAT